MVLMNKNTFVLYFLLVLTLTSCKTKDKVSELNYMQNVEQIAIDTAEAMIARLGVKASKADLKKAVTTALEKRA